VGGSNGLLVRCGDIMAQTLLQPTLPGEIKIDFGGRHYNDTSADVGKICMTQSHTLHILIWEDTYLVAIGDKWVALGSPSLSMVSRFTSGISLE